MSQLFASGCQSVGVSASGPVLLKSIQGWFSLGLTGLISLQSKGPSRVFSNTTVRKHQFFDALLSFLFSAHIYTWLLERPVCQLYLNKTGGKRNRKGDTPQGPAQAGVGGDLNQGRSRVRMGGDSKVQRWLESGFGPDPVTGWRWSRDDGGRQVLAPPGGAIHGGGDPWEAAPWERWMMFNVGSVAFAVFGGHPSGPESDRKTLGCLNQSSRQRVRLKVGIAVSILPMVGGLWNDRSCHPPSCTRGTLILLLFFWPRHSVCGILVPQPGIKPGPLAVRVQSSNHWITGEFPSWNRTKEPMVLVPHFFCLSLSVENF